MLRSTRYALPILASLLAPLAQAAAVPALKTQAPGYFRLAVGDYEVTALFDGYNDLSPGLLQGMSPERIRALLARQAIDGPNVQTNFNAFLVNTGQQLILVDTGAGQCIGATAGDLVPNLRAAGYAPEQVDTILLTHLHLDHVCGLVDGKGAAVFPRARVYAARQEADYWLSKTVEAAAPSKSREGFEIAQHSVAPYVASGQWATFTPPASPLPFVQTQLKAGHTPGSTAYRFESKGESIVFIGDLIHNVAVQFEHPEVAIRFDVDPAKAIDSRMSEFTELAHDHQWVAAAHLPFPGIGHVTGQSPGFHWAPVVYGPYQRAAQVPLLK